MGFGYCVSATVVFEKISYQIYTFFNKQHVSQHARLGFPDPEARPLAQIGLKQPKILDIIFECGKLY